MTSRKTDLRRYGLETAETATAGAAPGGVFIPSCGGWQAKVAKVGT